MVYEERNWKVGDYFLFVNKYHFLIGKIHYITITEVFYTPVIYRGIDKEGIEPSFSKLSFMNDVSFKIEEKDLEYFNKDKFMVELL